MASRRKRGPVALRPWLWPGLPLSDVTTLYVGMGEERQFGDVPKSNVRFGWLAALLTNISRMSTFGG